MADSSIIDRDAHWADFQLDPRLMKAISQDLGWERPTLVQSQAVKLALNGKDILARARTGSGKTGAYIIPILQQLLREKENGDYTPGVKVLVLVPTHELCIQVISVLTGLTKYCANLFSFLQLAADQSIDIQRPRLAELPDIVVATPGRLVEHLKKGHISVTKTLKFLVIDEADLILSYGYKGDIETVVQKLPKICQGFLMSATLDDDVENLKRLVLHTPAILKLEEDTSLATKLQQYVIFCPQKDKFLLIYVMLKLKLISGKMIVFVNEIDQAFRLKLFLERFSIKSAVLNSELPHNSRYHIVQEFNHGYFDILIATDEKSKFNKEDDDESAEENGEQEASDENEVDDDNEDDDNDDEDNQDEDDDEDNEEMSEDNEEQDDEDDEEQEESESGDDFDTALMSDVKQQLSKEEKKALRNKAKHDKLKAKKLSQKTESQDKEYGVTRGVDFKSVQIVINFDFPRTAKNYVHRIGRTARAGNAGVALSFVTDDDKELLTQVQEDQEDEGRTIQPYEFKMAIVEGFRYRVEDVLRSVTGAHVKDARIQDIKLEILNSEKLKSHFEDNPRDLESLQHHRPLQASRVLTHLKFVPHYLLPQKKGESAGTKIQTEEPDEILGYNKNFRQFKRKMNAQSNPLLTLSRNSNKRKYSDAMQDQSYERSNIITDVNPNKKRKRFKKH